ncbi:MAG: hypothetical protein WED04_11080 [Promethearchaeati archaeon SRVP18_Atabeyarchaeia-1]
MNSSKHILGEILSGSKPIEKPDIAEISAAGSLLGLDKEDIARIHRGPASSRVRTVLAKRPWIFLPIIIVVAALAILLAYALSGSPPSNPSQVYPSGARYNVISRADLKKKSLLT